MNELFKKKKNTSRLALARCSVRVLARRDAGVESRGSVNARGLECETNLLEI
jgi:hypothetical protein